MKIAIYGYGNLGRGVECALRQAPDMECVGVFTRRPPESVQTVLGAPVYHVDDLSAHKENIDVIIICGGSATDLPKMTPALAKEYNVVDSFDTHAAIPAHFAAVDAAAKEGGTVALISGGWDPGLFSLNRPARGQGLHLLGSWRQPGSLRRHPPHRRRGRRPPVHRAH